MNFLSRPPLIEAVGTANGQLMGGLANILGRRVDRGEAAWVYSFANGLVVHTDPFMWPDGARVLPIGGPQDMIMNRLVHWPEIVEGRRVLDAFCGSGVLGLMALSLGADHVDFVDVSPRAARFAEENCRRNSFAPPRWTVIEASVADFAPSEPYDLILANPPFVMTPPGLEGTLTSRAGPLGNDFASMLLRRLGGLLTPDGEIYLFLLQFVAHGQPLIVADPALANLDAALTPVQQEATSFAIYREAYLERFPRDREAIEAWSADLLQRYGQDLTVQHYILRARLAGVDQKSGWRIVNDLASAYGEGFAYSPENQKDLALGRVVENLIPRRSP